MKEEHQENKLLSKLSFKYRDVAKKLATAEQEKEFWYIKLHDKNSDEKFTIRDIGNLQKRYEEQVNACAQLEIEEKVWHECREMLFDIIALREK